MAGSRKSSRKSTRPWPSPELKLGPGHKPGQAYLIAEVGPNYRMGSPERDLAMCQVLIGLAAEAGADAVKFQAYSPQGMYADGPAKYSHLGRENLKLSEVVGELALGREMLARLGDMCRAQGVDFLCSAFSAQDFAAVDPLVAAHKIASSEINHGELLALAARSGKPVLLSCGASDFDDVAWALKQLDAAKSGPVCLLQCTAAYPAPPDSINLKAMAELGRRFNRPYGLSDHSENPLAAPLGAVALGARVIEKHYTLSRRLPGPDHSFAVEPAELAELVRHVRLLEMAMGSPDKTVGQPEKAVRRIARRAVHTTRPVAKGEVLRLGENIAILRPGSRKPGVHPKMLDRIEGRRARRALRRGHGLQAKDWE